MAGAGWGAAEVFTGRQIMTTSGGGTIVNISSIAAIAPEMLNGVYGATKAFRKMREPYNDGTPEILQA
jgi:NADP-dependent 3-hydroxy acid dehydrogenase YdfG